MKCVGCGVDVVGGHRPCPGCGAMVLGEFGTGQGEWHDLRLPSQRWELTSPESYLLRYAGLGLPNAGASAFRLGLIELVARRALRLEGAWMRRRWGPGVRFVWLLGDGPRMASVTERALAPVLAHYARLRDRRPRSGVEYRDPAVELEGVLVNDIARAAARGGGYREYLNRDVAGSLQRRGLLDAEKQRRPAGDQADGELDRWLELAKQFTRPSYNVDQSWKQAYLHGAGASILLVADAYPALVRVGRSLASPQASDQGFAMVVGPESGDGDGFSLTDGLGALDFAGLDQAFASVAGLDGALAIFDSGGGGGDGGGAGF